MKSRSEEWQGQHGDPNRQMSEIDNIAIKAFGHAVLDVGGQVDIYTDKVFHCAVVLLTACGTSLVGKLHYNNVVDGVSFRIHSDSPADAGKGVDWVIVGYHQ